MSVGNATGTVNWYSDANLSNLIFSGSAYTPANISVNTFWVVQTVDGCNSPASLVQLVPENAVTASIIPQGPLVICSGESLVLTSSSAVNNQWSTGAISQSITINNGGTYVLQVTGSCNMATDTIVIVEESVIADFDMSETSGFAPLTVSLTNTSTNSQSCVWLLNNSPNSALNTGQITFENQGNYAITLRCTSANGCKDEITKTVVIGEAEVQLYIPNSFTPNGDNLNDVFKIYGIGIKSIYVQIFNRWGELLHEWSGMDGGWDGTYLNRMVPQGLYSYRIKGVDSNNREIKKIGAITVLSE
jgi:gliding motility-associated-like protein